MIRTFFICLAVLVVGVLFFGSMVLFGIPALQESTVVLPKMTTQVGADEVGSNKGSLEKEITKLQSKLEKLTPTEAYIVINTNDNHFYLYKNKQLVRDGLCSSGKNERLVLNDSPKEYIFHTPLGVRKVISKQKNPVWAKPNWAFIEDGLPIPPPGDPSRFEAGTLGAYKLTLGDGYMIHGTIYKRFMGLSVTHGCVRLGDEDLEVVYNTMAIGSKVYIY